MTDRFPCTGCGSCCRRIGLYYPLYKKSGLDIDDKNSKWYFPYTWDKNNKCENLTPDNKCSVYNNRPLVCDIKNYFIHGMSKYYNTLEEFYKIQIEHCNTIMDEDNVSESFRIN